MNNSHNDNKNNLVSFLRHNQPSPPQASSDLEQRIINSLESRKFKDSRYYKTVTLTIPSALATGFLFATVSLGVRTPRLAIEPQDLENFIVNNWQDTLNANNAAFINDSEIDWFLPEVSEPEPTLSISAK